MGPWARGRARELADQLLDHAESFRQRWTECGHRLQSAGWAIAESIRDVPCICRERCEAFALAFRRAGSGAVEAALDLAWLVTQGAGWVRSRRRRIVALSVAPLVPALAVLVLFSSQTVGGSALAAASSFPRDAHRISAVDPVQGNVASRRHVVVRPERASRPARAGSGPRRTTRPMRVGVATKALRHRGGEARVALLPKAVARVAAKRPRLSAPPRRPVPPVAAPAGPVRETPVKTPKPAPTIAPAPQAAPTVSPAPQAAPRAEQPPDQRQHSTEIRPAAPAAQPPTATPAAEQAGPDATPGAAPPGHSQDGDEHGGGEKPKKEKEKHDDRGKGKRDG